MSKLKMKIGMCSYYQGHIKKAMSIFEDEGKYYDKFDPHDIKVQSKFIKCNFYFAKSLLAQKEKEKGAEGGVDYL